MDPMWKQLRRKTAMKGEKNKGRQIIKRR